MAKDVDVGTRASTENLIIQRCRELKKKATACGVTPEKLNELWQETVLLRKTQSRRSAWFGTVWPSLVLGTAVILGLVLATCGSYLELVQLFQSWKCIIGNNFFVMEVTRPVTNCSICSDTESVFILDNVTREVFSKYAYSSKPVLVKGATANWTALTTFSFDFFKRLYQETNGALDTVEEECQFFPFRTTFLTLREVFEMPVERANLTEGTAPWYIGWSNCNPDIADVLRQHYQRPHFLPDDSESSAIDWMFMGGTGPGASMHLDYVHRPSWQAQVSGSKTWELLPPPECEEICTPMNITVRKGDIVLIDTNQWYHNTYVNPGEISITIGSEYD